MVDTVKLTIKAREEHRMLERKSTNSRLRYALNILTAVQAITVKAKLLGETIGEVILNN
jgi:hypothetical protein